MKIKDIQFEVRSFRFEEPMKVAFATIVDMETCIVRMTTNEGITGFGEAAPFSYVMGDNLETVISVGNDLKRALIGMDPARDRGNPSRNGQYVCWYWFDHQDIHFAGTGNAC